MTKLIQSIRVNPKRAELLRDKAIELTIEQKEYVKETDLINFFIDAYLENLKIDKNGIFLEEDK